MAFIKETTGSRGGTVGPDNPTDRLLYTVWDTYDDAEVRAIVEATTPAFYGLLIIQNYTKEHLGGGVWEVVVHYGKRRPNEIGNVKFGFDTTGKTVRITQSIDHSYHVAEGDVVKDFKGAINVHGDGDSIKVEGVEVTIQSFAFTIERTHPNPPLGDYVDLLFLKTGHVNSDTINSTINSLTINAAPGELHFLGATGGESGLETFQITERWEFSPNRINVAFGDITVPSIRGHDYVWISYKIDSTNGMKKIPRQVCVEQVHEMSALSGLFI